MKTLFKIHPPSEKSFKENLISFILLNSHYYQYYFTFFSKIHKKLKIKVNALSISPNKLNNNFCIMTYPNPVLTCQCKDQKVEKSTITIIQNQHYKLHNK